MSDFTGTTWLVRLAARRDRIALPAWILGMTAFLAVTTAMFEDNYAKHPQLLEPDTRIVVENPGMRVLGLVTGPSVGGYTLHRDALTLAVLAAMMSVLAVVRHTRQSEELGREEMVGAGVVGRHASLAAAVVVALAANAGAGRASRPRHGGRRPARRRVARRRHVDRAGGRRLHRRRRGDVTAGVDVTRCDRSCRCGPRRLLPACRAGQHARDRGHGRAPGHERLAGLALRDRVEPADAAVRGQLLVAARTCCAVHGLAVLAGAHPRRQARCWSRNVARAQGCGPRDARPAEPGRTGLAAAARCAARLGDRSAWLRTGLRCTERADRRTRGGGGRVVRHLRR